MTVDTNDTNPPAGLASGEVQLTGGRRLLFGVRTEALLPPHGQRGLGNAATSIVSLRLPHWQRRELEAEAAARGEPLAVFARRCLAAAVAPVPTRDAAERLDAVAAALELPAGAEPATILDALEALLAALEGPPTERAPAPAPRSPGSQPTVPAALVGHARVTCGRHDFGPSSMVRHLAATPAGSFGPSAPGVAPAQSTAAFDAAFLRSGISPAQRAAYERAIAAREQRAAEARSAAAGRKANAAANRRNGYAGY